MNTARCRRSSHTERSDVTLNEAEQDHVILNEAERSEGPASQPGVRVIDHRTCVRPCSSLRWYDVATPWADPPVADRDAQRLFIEG